ncbi:reverse transcriptase domain-containing protein, partial [Tanacetum coccineum]
VVAPNPKPFIPYPSRANKQKLHEKDDKLASKFVKTFWELHFKLSFADALLHMPKFASVFKSLLNNKEKLFDLAKTPVNENCSAVILKKLPEKVGDPGKFLIPCEFPELVECLALANLVNSPSYDEAITFKVGQTSRYSYNDAVLINRIDVIDVSCEEYAQEELGFSDSSTSGNPTPSLDPILSTSFPSLTPFEGDLLLLEKLLNGDPSSPLPPKELHVEELKIVKSSIDDPPELELKDLPSHLEYEILESTDKLLVIIAKNLKEDEKVLLLKQVIKLLDAGLIYPISDSLWVSPVHCVPKKGGITIVENEDNELIPTRLVTEWRVCIDYRKLNDVTRKDHFPLPFMDQMLEQLARNEYYCFLDGFSRYFQIPIDPQDQYKTTFTCPYGTFSYRRMPFSLCNAPGTFQRCMMAIFHDMIEETMEVFKDDFSVFGDSFLSCLSHLDKMLKRCEDTNLVLNWEKCHFMVKEGIVLGHKISKSGIKVDKAKVDVIAKLPHPTSVKGTIVYTDHSDLKYLLAKQDAKPRFLRLENPHQGDLEKKEINETFPLETLGMISFHGDSSTP